jgi:hypothetical protein
MGETCIEIPILKPNIAKSVTRASHIHNSRMWSRGQHPLKQQIRPQEMPDMVFTNLHLDIFFGGRVGHTHITPALFIKPWILDAKGLERIC